MEVQEDDMEVQEEAVLQNSHLNYLHTGSRAFWSINSSFAIPVSIDKTIIRKLKKTNVHLPLIYE